MVYAFVFMVHIGQLIEQELRRQRRSVSWFAKELYCDRTNVYKLFRKESIDTLLLYRISCVLSHDFFKYYTDDFVSDNKPLRFCLRFVAVTSTNSICLNAFSSLTLHQFNFILIIKKKCYEEDFKIFELDVCGRIIGFVLF